ncbi:MAG TPA: type II secretion system protein [Dyella sp.]|nr:type II secretion system protein [Dyella sp.]
MIRRQAGFSLLEAIVALVILSLVAMALYGWQNANLFAIRRAEAHAVANDAARSALALVRTINPMLQPTGERPWGNGTIRWNASPVEPIKPGVTAVGLPGYFDIGLYRVRVEIVPASGPIQRLEVRQVGYKQVRFPSGDF